MNRHLSVNGLVRVVVPAATDLRYSATATVIDGAIAALEIRGFS
jgi:hypothetical protein